MKSPREFFDRLWDTIQDEVADPIGAAFTVVGLAILVLLTVRFS